MTRRTMGTKSGVDLNNNYDQWVAAIVHEYLKTVGDDVAACFQSKTNPPSLPEGSPTLSQVLEHYQRRAPKKQKFVFPDVEENEDDMSAQIVSDSEFNTSQGQGQSASASSSSTAGPSSSKTRLVAVKRTGQELTKPAAKKSKTSSKGRGRGKKKKSSNDSEEDNSIPVPKEELEAKFRSLGQGQSCSAATINATSTSSTEPLSTVPDQLTSNNFCPPPGSVPDEKLQAARAALTRLKTTSEEEESARLKRRQQELVKEEVRKQLAAQAVPQDETSQEVVEKEPEMSNSSCDLLFNCPYLGLKTLPRAEIEVKLLEHLKEQDQRVDDGGVAACLMIHSLNYSTQKIQICVELLCKHLDNMVNNPGDEKYHSIKCSNRAFKEKLADVNGVPEFLAAVGFTKQSIEIEDTWQGLVQEYYVFTKYGEETSLEHLEKLRDLLKTTQPIRIEVDRNVQVFLSPQIPGANQQDQEDLSLEFFALTKQDILKQQEDRTKTAQLELTVRTRVQKENDQILQPKKNYKFASIRIYFPDGFVLEGSFETSETVQDIYEFVRDNVDLNLANLDFALQVPRGPILSNLNNSILESNLAPATRLNFVLNKSVPDSVLFLKPHLLNLLN